MHDNRRSRYDDEFDERHSRAIDDEFDGLLDDAIGARASYRDRARAIDHQQGTQRSRSTVRWTTSRECAHCF